MYQQPPGGPQQPWQQGQPPPRKKKWPWVLLGCGIAALLVIVLAVACTGAFFSAFTGTSEDGSGESGTAQEASVGLGEPVDLGQWRVTVESVETETNYDETSPQGEFKVVALTVENIGTESTTFDSGALSLIDADGNTHSSSASVSDDSLFLEQINPGNQTSGTAVFDVPEGTEITAVEVQDTFSFEDPVTIRVD
ncbi:MULTISPECIES: DUF4352 domain-containing protein [unclassified Nocardiopsis]|uniref:DUF4352 domain-containing protein n=1 Tax=Nocardiopsis TaxID=2013 RepID=UPI00387B87FD